MMIFVISGLILSILVMFGLTNAIAQFLLWMTYMSFVHVGQVFYGFGWESILLEFGFLSIFMCPIKSVRPFPKAYPMPAFIQPLMMWFLFRIMFGAGLIKIRGDSSWLDLTALYYHFETQPIPNSFSWFFHFLPKPILRMGVLFNHFVELIVPFFYFFSYKLRYIAGGLTILFQMSLILSGNLSWLNWLTVIIALACFNDDFYLKKIPLFLKKHYEKVKDLSIQYTASTQWVLISFLCLILVLSMNPFLNLWSKNQLMNASFDPFHIVNTYGAFGHVGKSRYEIIILGTREKHLNKDTVWQEYQFKGKPGDVFKSPPIYAPYHYRLDWQIWFAAMSHYQQHPWLVHFIYKLLQKDVIAEGLLASIPFEEKPYYIKADLYQYQFNKNYFKEGAWWSGSFIREYLPPLSLGMPSLETFIRKLNGD